MLNQTQSAWVLQSLEGSELLKKELWHVTLRLISGIGGIISNGAF